MKKQLIFLSTIILCFNCYSQISFEKGYYIDNNNQKINCLIKNSDWKNNPIGFEYKLSENSESKKENIKSVKEFGIDNTAKYIRSTVNIDRSSESINDLSDDKNPIFIEEELFLKVLVEGKSNLYEYIEGNLTRYFYNVEDSNIQQLIYKSYKVNDLQVGKNNKFKQQLWVDLKCPNFKESNFEYLEYNKKDLIKFFIEYSACYNKELIKYQPKRKRDLFNLAIRPRINSSSLAIHNSATSSYDT